MSIAEARGRQLPRAGWARAFLRRRAAVAALSVLVLAAVAAYASLPVPVPGIRDGADGLGALAAGTRRSLAVGASAAPAAVAAGALWGLVAGSLSGRSGRVMARILDVALVLPFFAVVAVLAGGVRPDAWWQTALLIAAVAWTGTARVTGRAAAALWDGGFVEAAYASGATAGRVLRRHILPNLAGVLALAAALTFATAVLTEAALSFADLGGGAVSLGSLMRTAGSDPLPRWGSGGVIALLCLCAHITGDGLRSALERP